MLMFRIVRAINVVEGIALMLLGAIIKIFKPFLTGSKHLSAVVMVRI